MHELDKLGHVGEPRRSRGTLLWFNSDKNRGVVDTEEGERLDVPGAAFAPGLKPTGRCAGTLVEVEIVDGAVRRVVLLPTPNPRRARLRRTR